MIAANKAAAGIAMLIILALAPSALAQSDQISAQATYLEQLDVYLQSLHVTEITYNPDGSVAKTVTIDPAGPNRRTVIYNPDGSKNVLVQACSLAVNNALYYQLDQNGALIPGTKKISTIPCVSPTPTPAFEGTGSDIIVTPVVTHYFVYCETTKQWEEVKNV